MSGVFRNIDPSPAALVPGEDTLARGGGGGGGVNSSEDARHCFVLYICEYFVRKTIGNCVLPKTGCFGEATTFFKSLLFQDKLEYVSQGIHNSF
jgi:hypothetical protein